MNKSSSVPQIERTPVILMSVTVSNNTAFLNFYQGYELRQAVLRNPEVLQGNIITGAEIEINLFTFPRTSYLEAELLLVEDDFLPDQLCRMLECQPPSVSTFFGLISEPAENEGRYYMLRDYNADGLLLCSGTYRIKKNRAFCADFDGTWLLRYNMVENFFYGPERVESTITRWKHPSLKIKKIEEEITFKNLSKRFRNYAAGWHRYNFFCTADWSMRFYRKQAKLGFIAITHSYDGENKLTPQLQREYAVLDWENLVIDKKVNRIIKSGRIEVENIRLNIEDKPEEVLAHLTEVWSYTWLTEAYVRLIIELAAECRRKNDRRFRIWGVTLTAGNNRKTIAGELGYSIGKTYTSLTGFFHRGEKKYNNFGKLQMVMLAEKLQQSGIAFWNLGQPYMEYKLKLGAEIVPRSLFFKRWDKAVRGRTPDLKTQKPLKPLSSHSSGFDG